MFRQCHTCKNAFSVLSATRTTRNSRLFVSASRETFRAGDASGNIFNAYHATLGIGRQELGLGLGLV